LIATKETLALADQYLSAFLDEYMKGALPKAKLEMNRIEVELANAQIKTLQSVTLPPQRVADFADAITAWNKRIIDLSEESQTLMTETIAATAHSAERLDPLATEVTLSMREEIELSIDEDWFRELRTNAVATNTPRAQT